MIRRGHVPRRFCAGCGRRHAKAGLVRFTISETPCGRALELDSSGKGGGRGSYVCADESCLEQALKKKGLLRGMGEAVVPAELKDDFRRFIEARG